MASMRDSDTGLWLHNKLGSTDELWTPSSIGSLLTVSVIDNIRLCFSSLSPAVKLKLLLGMLHLPRRTVDEVGLRRDSHIHSLKHTPSHTLSLLRLIYLSFHTSITLTSPKHPALTSSTFLPSSPTATAAFSSVCLFFSPEEIKVAPVVHERKEVQLSLAKPQKKVWSELQQKPAVPLVSFRLIKTCIFFRTQQQLQTNTVNSSVGSGNGKTGLKLRVWGFRQKSGLFNQVWCEFTLK